MNQPLLPLQPPSQNSEDEMDLATYLDILFDHWKLIAGIALTISLLGAAYAFMATPIYESNMLFQVEDNSSAAPLASSQGGMGSVAALLDAAKASTPAEIEILRTRMVLSNAVNKLNLTISARPKYFPVIGAWMARRSNRLSAPGLFGYGGYCWGTERIDIASFTVPPPLEGASFVLTAEDGGRFHLLQKQQDIDLEGHVGVPLSVHTSSGNITLNVQRIIARPGAEFLLTRQPELAVIGNLQRTLGVAEKGRGTGIVSVALDGPDPKLTTAILTEIGNEYLRQNLARKSEEAEKSLVFLENQLPQLKQQMEASEDKLTQFRKTNTAIDLGAEATAALQLGVSLQTQLAELKSKKDVLLLTDTEQHPEVQMLDGQIKDLQGQIDALNRKVKSLPAVEQDLLRLTSDVKVNTELYTSVLTMAEQMRLAKASKVGNVRLLDAAVSSLYPVRPNRLLILVGSILAGVIAGVVAAFIKKTLYGAIESANEIEQKLGLTVYASIPHSKKQMELHAKLGGKSKQVLLLSQQDPNDIAIESLRSLRTALQFSLLDAKNNIIMVTGATPGLGKSFVTANLADVLAFSGKRVLLIDGDIRKGYLNNYFGQDRENGLSELIAGTVGLEQALRKNVINNIDFIPTGSLPPNPSELLLRENFKMQLQALSEQYDYVLLDTPPVLAVSDATIAGMSAGTIFMVARAGVSNLGDLGEAVKRITQSGLKINGVILNDLKFRPGRYGYGNKYGKYRMQKYSY